MRVSIPTVRVLTQQTPSRPPLSLEAAVERVRVFIAPGNTAVLTGAGVSTDSGIRAYRGLEGRYLNPNFKPIFYGDLVEDSPKGHAYRQRYWARSFLGWPRLIAARPNPTHAALASLMHTGHVPHLITQNVDGLHLDALRSPHLHSRVLELHGSLHTVHCRRKHANPRDEFQRQLALSNPEWAELEESFRRGKEKPRTNPDGDVELEGTVSFENFVIPPCPQCQLEGVTETNVCQRSSPSIPHLNNPRETQVKPEVVFFGETVPSAVRDRSYQVIEETDRLLIVGTTLATYSAYRLVKHALELSRPILLLTLGPTRADVHELIEKLEVPSGPVIHQAARELIGSRLATDEALSTVLESGVITSVEEL
ncbi:DHS-like NAD/FAD-binding domain-containing protein [Auriculariales sp. MPI-PUGE-AT-0066]|nr:DHS-like NAD/FAD-binding domain-containing protein [Auriculariales sp. MPI-PUGE-AT-0066]